MAKTKLELKGFTEDFQQLVETIFLRAVLGSCY